MREKIVFDKQCLEILNLYDPHSRQSVAAAWNQRPDVSSADEPQVDTF